MAHQYSFKKCGALLGTAIALFSITGPLSAGGGPKTHQISIREFLFTPQEITIEVGDRVEWVNEDVVPHTATQVDYAWDTDMLRKSMTGSIVFEAPGTINYKCDYHPVMSGTIIVKEKSK